MQRALAANACDYVMPDVQQIGGVTGWMRGSALAQAPVERGRYLVESILGCGNCHTPKSADGAPMDLKAWYAGDVVYRTQDVIALVARRYGKKCRTATQLREYLREEHGFGG